MTGHAVVIAGAGPTGLMLAGELALAGVDVAIVERRASQELDGSRSGGLHSRTIEVLDQRGIAGRFLAEGQAMQIQSFAGIPLDISDFPTRHNYGLALWQSHFERILTAWVGELGVPVAREHEVTGFAQDGTGVHVKLSDGQSLRADYLVGCDGGRSLIRKAAGIEFPGWDPSVSSLVAEVKMSEEPEWGIRYDDKGTQALGTLEDGKRARVVVSERYAGQTAEPTLRDLSRALITVWGTDYGVHNPTWISRFTDMTRQAASYRNGRVLLAGDAAHVHYPVGGQGLNTGVQDAVNLGWKLAHVVKGTSPEGLLDTYHGERHPVAARVLRNTMAQTALTRSNGRIDALRNTMSELLSMDEPRARFAAMITGLDIHYELGEGHPLLGRRMPDLDLVTADGPLRVFTLLHDARPVLLNLGEPGGIDITPWADRVQLIDAKYVGLWELPVLGEVPAPAAVLIRPDGYVAWAGDPAHQGLQILRERRGLSRPVLAGLVGMSPSWLKGIERGTRLPPRLPLLVKLAEALAVGDVAVLAGTDMDLGGAASVPVASFARIPHDAVPAIREAIRDPLLMVPASPVDVAPLAARTADAWLLWHQSAQHRTDVGRILPRLVTDAPIAARTSEDSGRRAASAVLAELYALVQHEVVWASEAELTWTVADRAMSAAQDADNARGAGRGRVDAGHGAALGR